MKKLLVICAAFLAISPIFSQEESTSAQPALIGDLMTVTPVEAVEAENAVELGEEFQKTYDESKSGLDENLTKLGEDYKKDVTGIIEKFTKILEKGNEQDVKNEKLRVTTQVNSLTIFLRKNKKNAVARFNSKMLIASKKLPKSTIKGKESEIKNTVRDYYHSFETEFKANQATIKNFKKTEHLVAPTGVQGQ